MRTRMEIDEKLMQEAMLASGAKTKSAAVDAALRLLVRLKAQEGVRSLRGKVKWEGGLGELRKSRSSVVDVDGES